MYKRGTATKIIADNIKGYRDQIEVSQMKFAKMVNINRTYIWDIENEKKNVSVEMLFRIADAFGIEPYLLLMKDSYKKHNAKPRTDF